MSHKCPRCDLFSPDEATRCDCGYDFTTNTMESSYLLADTVRKFGGEQGLIEHTARSNVRTGAILLAVAAVVSAVSYIGSGRLSVSGGAAMLGTVFLYRGLRQSRAMRK